MVKTITILTAVAMLNACSFGQLSTLPSSTVQIAWWSNAGTIDVPKVNKVDYFFPSLEGRE